MRRSASTTRRSSTSKRHGELTRAFVLSRTGRSRFTERDRQVPWTLRPHLVRLLVPSPASSVLTQREREILSWVQRGRTTKEIARELVISTGTVRKHLENIFSKLGVHTRLAAITKATRLAEPELSRW
jgi:DNA-binding CsgD family transcriptional regulator